MLTRLGQIDGVCGSCHFHRTGSLVDGDVVRATGKKSDIWVDNVSVRDKNPAYYSPYYDEFGNKTNEFDGEYWITLTPSRRSYVTLGDDNENYPSVQFLTNPVKYEISKIENAFRTSPNMGEQLFYVYGISAMKSLGNLHNLYFTELQF